MLTFILCLLFAYIAYRIIKTKRHLDWQTEQFEKKGYKVKKLPFGLFPGPFFELYGIFNRKNK